jgi:hypothetical protein
MREYCDCKENIIIVVRDVCLEEEDVDNRLLLVVMLVFVRLSQITTSIYSSFPNSDNDFTGLYVSIIFIHYNF